MEGRTRFEHIEADLRLRQQFSGEVYPLVAVSARKPGELEGFGADGFVNRLDPRQEEVR